MDFKDFKDLIRKISLLPCKNVRCDREGEHDFKSVDVESELLKNKEDGPLLFRIVIRGDKFIAGLDLPGRDLSKRQYRVFNHPNNVKGAIAAAALYFAEAETPFLDPLGLSGTTAIEMALKKTGLSVNYYSKDFDFFKLDSFNKHKDVLEEVDSLKKSVENIYSFDPKFRNLSAQKKNAKIAGVEKDLEFSRCDLSYLDIKLESLNTILTLPMEPSKNLSESRAIEFNNILYKQSRLLLKRDDGLTLITRKPDFIKSTMKGFEVMKEHCVFQGKTKYFFLKLRRSEK